MARKQRYQSGGLAEVAGSYDDEENASMPDPSVDPEQPGALEQVATPISEEIVANAMPDPLRKAREINTMSRDAAIARLTAGRDALQKKQYDPSAKWLAMAQGFLAPTRTGGFGESVSNAAGRVGDVVKDTQDYNTGHEKQLLDLEAEMAKAEESYSEREIDILQAEQTSRDSRRGARGVPWPAYLPDPDNPGKEILVQMVADDSAPGGVRALTLDGRVLRVPDNLDPFTRGLISQAVTRGSLDATDLSKQIDKSRLGRERLATTYFGLDILKEVRKEGGTGGIQNWVQKIREVFGSEAKDVADRGQLMALMGDQLFSALESFGSQINERELMTARTELASGATRSTAVNERLLQQLAMKLEAEVSSVRGLTQAYGDPQQIYSASRPIVDYGLTKETRARGEKIGFEFKEYVPFDADEVKPPPKPRKPGEQGHVATPWKPKNGAEANALMRDPASAGAQAGDFFEIIDPKTGKPVVLQVK